MKRIVAVVRTIVREEKILIVDTVTNEEEFINNLNINSYPLEKIIEVIEL